MSSFNDTVDLERSFLRAVTNSAILARMYLHQAKEEMFTSDQRQTIFSLAEIALNESNSLLTRQIFEYEIKARFSDEHIANCICEWNIVEGISTYDSPEAILAKIKEAAIGRKTLKVSEDIVEMLQRGDIKEAVTFLKREAMLIGGAAKDERPVTNLTDIQARLQLIRDKQKNPEKYSGLKTGLKTFDLMTGGVFPGELTLLAGITGLGKSTLCRTLGKGMATLNGCKNVLHVANEEYLEQVEYKYDALYTGIPYQDFKFATISEENLDRWQKYMEGTLREQGRGQVFVKEVPAFTDVTLVEQQFRILENRGIPIHAIIIDHLPNVKPIQQAWGENDERAKAAADCKELARQLRVPVITPTQAATEVEKKTQQGKRASKMDVYGSKGQVHVANTFMIITYKGTDDTQVDLPDYLRDVYWMCDAKKVRDGAPFHFMAKHMVKTGTVIEIDDPGTKPSTVANKEIDDILKKATEGTTASQPVPGKETSVPVVPVEIRPVTALNTGLRDASVEFAEEIDDHSCIEEGKDVEDVSGDNLPVMSARAILEKDRLEREAAGFVKNSDSVKKSLLDTIRSAHLRMDEV